MLYFIYSGKVLFSLSDEISRDTVNQEVAHHLGEIGDYYLTCNGKIIRDTTKLKECFVHIGPRVLGGKGGFGSMLRAIGAQIEKTTNREACRDLSGRRLRDINEEKRLKTWIAQQAEREKEKEDRRQKKIQKFCQKPKHEFKDDDYEKERSLLPEKVQDALEQGLKASGSGECSSKRKAEDEKKPKNKKTRLWMDSEEELSSSIESDSDDDGKEKLKAVKTENSNSSEQDSCEQPDSIAQDTSTEQKNPSVNIENQNEQEISTENKCLENSTEQKNDADQNEDVPLEKEK